MRVLILLSAFIDAIVNAFKAIYEWAKGVYASILHIWPWQDAFRFKWVLLILFVLIVLIIMLICCSVKKRKKRKVVFIDGNSVLKVCKTKFRKPIEYPEEPQKEGFKFLGWYMDKKFKKQYTFDVLKKKKNLYLYAKFIE